MNNFFNFKLPFHSFTFRSNFNFSSPPQNRVYKYVTDSFHQVAKIPFLKEKVVPLYMRNIKPLTSLDYTIAGTSVIGMTLLTSLAIQTLGIGILPLAVGVDMFILTGTHMVLRHHIDFHFNNEAWKGVDKIRKELSSVSLEKADFSKINPLVQQLKQPEFDHLKDKLEKMEKEIGDFETIMNNHLYKTQTLEIQNEKIKEKQEKGNTLIKKLETLQNSLVSQKVPSYPLLSFPTLDLDNISTIVYDQTGCNSHTSVDDDDSEQETETQTENSEVNQTAFLDVKNLYDDESVDTESVYTEIVDPESACNTPQISPKNKFIHNYENPWNPNSRKQLVTRRRKPEKKEETALNKTGEIQISNLFKRRNLNTSTMIEELRTSYLKSKNQKKSNSSHSPCPPRPPRPARSSRRPQTPKKNNSYLSYTNAYNEQSRFKHSPQRAQKPIFDDSLSDISEKESNPQTKPPGLGVFTRRNSLAKKTLPINQRSQIKK